MSNSTTIGNKISEARKKMNISQARLAQDLFISAQAVGKWERGESMPDITTFNRLAEILGVDLNYFSDSFQSNAQPGAPAASLERETDQALLPTAGRKLITNFNGRNLPKSDLAGVRLHDGKFIGSALRASDFSGADLTGSAFKASDLSDVNFDGADLSDATFNAVSLSRASFRQSILVRTSITASALDGVTFADVKLADVRFSMLDLRKTTFEHCSFDGTQFDKCELRGMSLAGFTFVDVTFDNSSLTGVSFSGAILKNVSFQAPHAITNKFFRSLKTINFEGAQLDKLTYAHLKGLGVDLANATVI